jgi:hypothetical protein
MRPAAEGNRAFAVMPVFSTGGGDGKGVDRRFQNGLQFSNRPAVDGK